MFKFRYFGSTDDARRLERSMEGLFVASRKNCALWLCTFASSSHRNTASTPKNMGHDAPHATLNSSTTPGTLLQRDEPTHAQSSNQSHQVSRRVMSPRRNAESNSGTAVSPTKGSRKRSHSAAAPCAAPTRGAPPDSLGAWLETASEVLGRSDGGLPHAV